MQRRKECDMGRDIIVKENETTKGPTVGVGGSERNLSKGDASGKEHDGGHRRPQRKSDIQHLRSTIHRDLHHVSSSLTSPLPSPAGIYDVKIRAFAQGTQGPGNSRQQHQPSLTVNPIMPSLSSSLRASDQLFSASKQTPLS